MKAELSPAVEALRTQLREQEAEVNETKKTINSLLKLMGEQPEFSDIDGAQQQQPQQSSAGSGTRPDQYYGKRFATAAQEYLERRKQACSADEILKALEQGGFDFRALGWKDNIRLRNVAISLAKNNQKFHKLPNNTFGLLAWYPNVGERNGDNG